MRILLARIQPEAGGVRRTSRRANRNRSQRRSAANALLLLGLCTFIGLCILSNASTAIAEPPPNSASARRIGELFAASCAPCHVASDSGAPQIGIAADWRARTRQGRAELLRHTIDGYLDMPPLGSCGGCTLADFRALIHLLVPPDAWDAVPVDADAESR